MKSGKRIIALLLLVLAALLLTACQSDTKPEENESKDNNTTNNVVENFKTRGLNNVEQDFYNILSQAELTVINVWNPSCQACGEDMKALGEIGRQYAGYGVQVVGIIKEVEDSQDEAALSLIADTKADYIHLLDSEEMDKQLLGKYKDAPVTLFLDKNGNQLGEAYTEAHDKEFWNEQIEKHHGDVCIGRHPAEDGVG